MLNKDSKAKIIKKVSKHDTDTGSSEAQVAILSARINELTEHLKEHRGDNHSRRGLITMVAKRKKHLAYLKENNQEGYEKVLKVTKLKK
ncbi:MAG: small subunit ribosomal protein S15 [Flavobacteriaceae bacterium]|jgi:small subunit ribosomal protein S15